jgi:hypothetical protein
MKTARLNEKMPEAVFATLLVDAAYRGDSKELDSLASALLTRPSRERRLIFIEQHAQTELTALWAMELWRSYAKAQSFLAVAVSPDTTSESAGLAMFMRDAQMKNVASLIEAMKQICADRGIPFDGAARMAGIDEIAADPDMTPIPSLVEEYRLTYGHSGRA